MGRFDAEHASAAGRRRRGHSIFFQERWPRLLRSLYPIGGVVFGRRPGADDRRSGARLPRRHQGVDAQGRRYHALNPDVFYWAHATFFVGTIIVADRLCGGITEEEKRQLFDEHVQWYSMYGMSMRPVPETWEDFQVYWEHMCTGSWRTTRPPATCSTCATCRSRRSSRGCRSGCGAPIAP